MTTARARRGTSTCSSTHPTSSTHPATDRASIRPAAQTDAAARSLAPSPAAAPGSPAPPTTPTSPQSSGPVSLGAAKGLRGLREALAVRNYRLYVSSQLLTNPAGWMQRVAQDWLMLTLTGSVAMVGLTVTLQLGPMLLFGLFGGVIADRYSKRTILMVTQSLFATSALTIGVLTLAGALRPWHILLAAFCGGLATVVDNPARQAFVPEVAGPSRLRDAISLNSTVFQLGGLIGPALAGVTIAAVGEGWAFIINASAGLTAVALLVAMRTSELHPGPRVQRAPGQLRQGLRYVSAHPEILWSIVLVGFVAVTGVNLAVVLAAYADQVFDIGAGGYGALMSCTATGAVIGALASTRRRTLRLRTLVASAAAVGALQLVASLAGTPWLLGPALVAVGCATLLYLTGSNTLVQTSVDPMMRGRVMSLYILVLFGAQAAAGSIIGNVAQAFGPRVALMVCAAGPLIGVVVVSAVLARRGQLKPKVILRERPGRGIVYVVDRDPHPERSAA